jgi:hypothetical protein
VLDKCEYELLVFVRVADEGRGHVAKLKAGVRLNDIASTVPALNRRVLSPTFGINGASFFLCLSPCQHQRELERQARLSEREQMQALREAERARRAYERANAAEEKEHKRLYLESRVADVEALNE